MVEFAPSTGGLALWVRHMDLPPSVKPSRPPVATDGHTLHYDAAFEALPVAAQAGLVAHEVMHVALRHAQRFHELRERLGDVDLQLFNLCADAIVNSALEPLGWLALAPQAVRLDRLLAAVKIEHGGIDQALMEWDVERLYRAIDDRSQAGDGQRAASARTLAARNGPADLLTEEPVNGAPERRAEESREWSERILRAHTDDGAYSMLRVLLADLRGSRTPWEQVLRTRLARGLSRRPSLSWSRPSRSYLANQGRIGARGRLPFEPGFGGSRLAPRLALVIDVSGSIEPALLERFSREIEAILRRQEAALTLVIGDDQVRRIEQLDPDRWRMRRLVLQEIDFQGGGGTDFTPLLEAADLHRPDIGVVLTDLDGPARFRPRWPVIWVVPPANAAAVAPFGRVLVLD
jgi:predicted metal-dependent peptidase